MGFIGRSFIVRRIIRWLDHHLSPRDLFKSLFDEYKPDLIFSTDVQNENDVSLAQDAIRRRVPVIGMIRSWDNPTQRILRFFPEKLLVGSSALYDEVWKHYRFPKERTAIVGNPHYDKYLKPKICSREEFFRKWGLDPAKKLVLYTASGHILMKVNDYDQYIMETLGKFSGQVLVRFPLSGDVRLVNFEKPANMVIDKPGEKFGNKELELREEDDISLIEQLTYSDIIVTGPTSVCLDAALLDRPVLAADFYPTERHLYEKNWGFLTAHIKNLLHTGGVWYVKSPTEMFEAIDAYLANPRLHSEGRAKIRQKWFSHIDGRSSERLAGELLEILRLHSE
jgi:hypothetical protein